MATVRRVTDVHTVDHVNLWTPADGVDRAVEFYRDALRFATEGLDEFRADERSFFESDSPPRT